MAGSSGKFVLGRRTEVVGADDERSERSSRFSYLAANSISKSPAGFCGRRALLTVRSFCKRLRQAANSYGGNFDGSRNSAQGFKGLLLARRNLRAIPSTSSDGRSKAMSPTDKTFHSPSSRTGQTGCGALRRTPASEASAKSTRQKGRTGRARSAPNLEFQRCRYGVVQLTIGGRRHLRISWVPGSLRRTRRFIQLRASGPL